MERTLRNLVSALALATLGLAMVPAARAAAERAYKVGDRVEADPMLLNIWRKATVVKVHMAGGRVHGYEVRMDQDGESQVKEEYTVGTTIARGVRPLSEREETPPAAKEKPEAENPPATKATAARQPENAPSCSSDASLLAKGSAGDSRTLSFERAILGAYQKRVEEKGLSSPLAVGITFDSFQLGEPRRNERTLDRLDGSYIRSAPVGSSVYPVKTRFTVCEVYAREVTRTVVDGRYECFKDNFSEWACANASGWRTLETKREPREGR